VNIFVSQGTGLFIIFLFLFHKNTNLRVRIGLLYYSRIELQG